MTSARGPADAYRETARALLRAVRGVDPEAAVHTQGRSLRTHALVSTLAVEAAIHHVDLGQVMPTPPA